MRETEKKTIGDILLGRGMLSKSQLNMAMKVQEPARKSGEELVEIGILLPDELEVALDLQLADILVGMGYVDEKVLFGSSRTIVVSKHHESPEQSFDSFEFLDF